MFRAHLPRLENGVDEGALVPPPISPFFLGWLQNELSLLKSIALSAMYWWSSVSMNVFPLRILSSSINNCVSSLEVTCNVGSKANRENRAKGVSGLRILRTGTLLNLAMFYSIPFVSLARNCFPCKTNKHFPKQNF